MSDMGSPSGGISSHPLLLVEDNPGDARLLEEAASQALASELSVVSTGSEAIEFVTRSGAYAEASRPALILLDWNLPDMDGGQVLATLREDPTLDPIPVIVLTGSQSDAGVRESYSQGANACIIKPTDPDELEETLRVLEEFWLSTARLPAGDGKR